MLNLIDLKYRYGFVITKDKNLLSTETAEILERWNILECGKAAIAFHYEAKLTEFHFQDHIVYALGDVFVAHGNETLQEAFRNFVDNDDWASIDNLSGRFAVAVFNKNHQSIDKVFADPFGSRTLFYSTDTKGIVSSHATLIAEILNAKRNNSVIEFVKLPDFRAITTKFLPADLTVHDAIYGMPANHYYSFKLEKVVRFWPRSDIRQCDLQSFLSISEEYLERFIDYFIKSGIRPIIGLTGGVDCRTIIAAWNKRGSQFKCLTWDKGLSRDEEVVISNIRSYIKADCYVLDPNKSLNGGYFDALRKSGHANRGSIFPQGSVLTAQTSEFVDPSNAFVRGLGGEILRGLFNKCNSNQHGADDFSYSLDLFKTKKISDPSKEFLSSLEFFYQGFFERIGVYESKRYNYDFGDMIYWEQRMSMWGASLLNEADPALKNFVGLNSRVMYEASYGLPPEERFQRSLLLKITEIFDSHLANIDKKLRP